MADAARAPGSVLMTADTVGGVFSYAIELARALAARGVRTSLATLGGPLSAPQREAAGRVPGLAVFESSFRLEWMEDPWDDVARAGDWLLELEERLRPALIHLNGYAHGALDFRAPKLVVAHSCVLSWWAAVLGGEAPPRYDRYRREVARGLAAASAVVAPTRAMLDALLRHHGPLPAGSRAEVISNAADPARFAPRPKEELVLAVGRLWDQAKNIEALGEVAPHLPWPIQVAGSDVRPGGGASAIPLPSLERLGVLSPSAVAAALGRASIYAHPARYEPFGLSVLEAALSGCALVLGDIPSLREVWGDAALYVDPGDTEALRRALRTLIDAPGARREMAARARARALGFSPRRMARGYLRLYGELLGRGRSEQRSPAREARSPARDAAVVLERRGTSGFAAALPAKKASTPCA
ncbi:glycosyltransferase family 4 protein [Sorangium atrum]|uniref:Glycosyltransferase family 4 protein n=1 Tax=Sorangium atrum TaxID=2995308 RepID=A0ABT5BZ50_9BACT|nr:glycosyltransferase family 4 protein [Sorangium aterium]MDC0678895.1 glycosyltransferase family 4 protein [Sorangium aterium]